MGELAVLNRSSANLDCLRIFLHPPPGHGARQAALAETQSLQDYRRRLRTSLRFWSPLLLRGRRRDGGTHAGQWRCRASSLARKNADRLAHGLPPAACLPVGEDEIGLVDALAWSAARLLGRGEIELRERTSQLETANRQPRRSATR